MVKSAPVLWTLSDNVERSFPGGYVTLGIRDNSIFNPGTFSNEHIQVDIEGTIKFEGKNCSVDIINKRIYFADTQQSLSGFVSRVNIENYEVGRPYNASQLIVGGWKQNVVILSDDALNPVFVFGLAK